MRPLGAAWPVAAMASHFGAAVSPEAEKRLCTWLDLLVTWNRTHDLTAARSQAELLDLMLADAFALSPRVPESARLVDVGSGAGAPGLPLALLRPDLKVTLAEPLAKRAAFLRTCLAQLDRLDVLVEQQRGEKLASLSPGMWDVAISRATLPAPEWLALGARLVGGGGGVWVLLARDAAPALGEATQEEEVAYVWPNAGSSRRAVRYRVAAP